MMINKLRNYLLGLVCASLIVSTANAMQDPEAVVKKTVDAIVTNISSNRDAYRADNTKLFNMVEKELIPAIHVERMSRLILAKNWRTATPAQKKQFTKEFQTFLMRTYATALLEYSGQTVNYRPSDVKPDGDRVVVKAELVSNSGERYPISLFMSNRGDTSWRAYNIEVAGINFVAQYRQTFADIVSQKGIDGLLADLKQKNTNSGA